MVISRHVRSGAGNGGDVELGYRRVLLKRVLHAEQITAWRAACEQANDLDRARSAQLSKATTEDRKKVKELESVLARTEKALTEAVALLVL